MRDVEQSSYAIEGAASAGLPTWVGFSCKAVGDGEQPMMMDTAGETFAASLERLPAPGASLLSVMHTQVEDTASALRVLRETWSGPMGAYAHSGGFVMPDWLFGNLITPDDYVVQAQEWVAMGVQAVGGCCGIGPDHIRLLRERLPAHVYGA